MRRQTFRNIEDTLRDYPDYENHVAERRAMLLNPDNLYSDENIGGGRNSSVSNPTEQKALTLAEDRELQLIKYQHRKITKVIEETDCITNKLIKEYYFARPQLKTWEGIALDNGISKTQCLRLRDKFFISVADELGLRKR